MKESRIQVGEKCLIERGFGWMLPGGIAFANSSNIEIRLMSINVDEHIVYPDIEYSGDASFMEKASEANTALFV